MTRVAQARLQTRLQLHFGHAHKSRALPACWAYFLGEQSAMYARRKVQFQLRKLSVRL